MNLDGWIGLSKPRAAAIRSLPTPFTLRHLRARGFMLRRERAGGRRLEVFYAPFDWINQKAEVVLVGITPGWHQTEIAFQAARAALREGCAADEACRRAKYSASFAGPMRKNLVTMLDDLCLFRHLRIRSSAELFSSHAHLLHTASVIRFPVFVNGQNYTGHTPPLLETPLLREIALVVLAKQLAQVANALVIPLGKAVSEALGLLIQEKKLDGNRCLLGFPHPSGQNGHRVKEFRRRRNGLKNTLVTWFRFRVATKQGPTEGAARPSITRTAYHTS